MISVDAPAAHQRVCAGAALLYSTWTARLSFADKNRAARGMMRCCALSSGRGLGARMREVAQVHGELLHMAEAEMQMQASRGSAVECQGLSTGTYIGGLTSESACI